MNEITNKKGFTFVELIVAIILSSIIFLFLMNFIGKTFSEIGYSRNKTKIISVIYEFQEDVLKIREKYNSGIILINNDEGVGSDIILLRKDITNDGGYIIAQVNKNSLKIDGDDNVDIIGNKVLGLRKISSFELNELISDPTKVYNYYFNQDELFNNIKLKDLQVTLFNSDALFDVNYFINPFYNTKIDGQKYSEKGTNNIEKDNLIF